MLGKGLVLGCISLMVMPPLAESTEAKLKYSIMSAIREALEHRGVMQYVTGSVVSFTA